MLMAGQISHTSTQYILSIFYISMDQYILSIFYISMDLSTNYFDHFSGC